MKNYTVKLKIDKHFDTLNRVLNKFSGRGFNPQSVVFNSFEDENYGLLTLTIIGNIASIQLVLKKLNSFIDVHHIINFEESKSLKVS